MRTPLLSIKELAVDFGVSEATIRRAVWRGAIPYFRIGKVLRFDLEAVLAACKFRKARALRVSTGQSVRWQSS